MTNHSFLLAPPGFCLFHGAIVKTLYSSDLKRILGDADPDKGTIWVANVGSTSIVMSEVHKDGVQVVLNHSENRSKYLNALVRHVSNTAEHQLIYPFLRAYNYDALDILGGAERVTTIFANYDVYLLSTGAFQSRLGPHEHHRSIFIFPKGNLHNQDQVIARISEIVYSSSKR